MCGHAQAISGVFSVASHSALQYLPDVVTHEQSGCAHFSAFSEAIFFPPNFGSRSDDPSPNASLHERLFLYRKEHLATVVRTVGAIDGNPLFSITRLLLLCGRLGRDSGLSGSRELRGLTTLRVSNCEQMFADSGVILCVYSVGRKRRRSFSAVSLFSRDVQALAVSSSESDYIRSRI